MSVPEILQSTPEPQVTQKQFNGKKLVIWEGEIDVDNIIGWVNNRRLDLEIKRFRDQHAGREPDNDEIFAIMKSVKDFKLKDLADDIRVNLVRVPIVVSSKGKLLDGNRRYYAVRMILESLKDDDPAKADFTSIPAWVLESNKEEDEERIIVQENFYQSYKVEWTYYIKAQQIYQDLQKKDPTKTVAQRYNWSEGAIRDTRRIMELIDDFLVFATTEPDDENEELGLGLPQVEAERIAAENYQYFNEAQKSFRNRLEQDLDFKQQFFLWIHQKKFASFPEVRIAEEAYDNPKVKKILMSDEPKAGRKARALIDYDKNFEKEAQIAEATIEDFVRFLSELTTVQKREIPKESLDNLESALSTVLQMIKSSKGNSKKSA